MDKCPRCNTYFDTCPCCGESFCPDCHSSESDLEGEEEGEEE